MVTGAAGFLGLHIVKQLVARGDRVRAICRRESPELDALGVGQVRADIRDAEATADACNQIDTVFHVAAVAGIWGPWKHFYSTNVLGTQNIVAGCRLHGVPRLVLTSSPSVTFDGRPQEGIDERAPYPRRWLCHYPHTKALAERHVLSANRPGTLHACSLRPHLIWGPGDPHLVPRLLQRARSGRLRRVGDGTNLIDTIFVENAAAAHLLAADAMAAAADGSPVAGRAYFISQGRPVNCWDWINEILALAGLPKINRSISLSAAWKIGACLEVAHRLLGRKSEPRMTRFLAAQLGLSHYFDISRAREDFGYRPEISTEEGMRRLKQEFTPTRSDWVAGSERSDGPVR